MAVKVSNLNIDNESPLTLIAGPCVIESKDMIHDIAGKIKEITESLGIGYIFKSSFDKANRTSINSFRGPGMEEGLSILESVRDQLGLPVITDVHEDTPLKRRGELGHVGIAIMDSILIRLIAKTTSVPTMTPPASSMY